MSDKILNINEMYIEKMRNLDAEFKVYEKLRIRAICRRNECLMKRDYEGAMAWDKVREDCVEERILIKERIKDLYYECIRFNARNET